ncbi:MAG: hypothetical protein ACRDOI_45630 [Trebonia sp.]
MNPGHFPRATRIARISALGLGVGLALSACNPSTSSAAGATPSASGQAATASASDSAGSSGSNATPENVNGQPPALLDDQANPLVEPSNYDLDNFDAINKLENLHWTKWGQTAVATGTENLNPCVPSCTTVKSASYPVSIKAYGVDAHHNYTEMTISYAGAMPTISPGETGGQITQRQSNSWSEKLDNPAGT